MKEAKKPLPRHAQPLLLQLRSNPPMRGGGGPALFRKKQLPRALGMDIKTKKNTRGFGMGVILRLSCT